MRIVIDMQGAQTESRFRGIGRYTMSFAKALINVGSKHEILLLCNGLFPESINFIRNEFSGLLGKDSIYVWYAPFPLNEIEDGNEWRLSAAKKIRLDFIEKLQPDILHISSFFEGYFDDALTNFSWERSNYLTSILVHDLIPLVHKADYLDSNKGYANFYYEKVKELAKANIFLTNSNHTLKEANDLLELAMENCKAVFAAVDAQFRKLDISLINKNIFIDEFKILKPFILYTGGADKRKNIPGLLRAYAALPNHIRNQYHLVLAGRMPDQDRDNLLNLSKSIGLSEGDVIFTGYISDKDLVIFYNLCVLYVFPSWHEGFGFPVLEGMSCGAPVLCSNNTSVIEVFDREDATFNPYDIDEISTKMLLALCNPEWRDELSRYGQIRAKKFSWEVVASNALDFFEKKYSVDTRQREITAADSLDELLADIAGIKGRPAAGDLAQCAAAIELNKIIKPGLRKIFVDVSELNSRDAKTGIQRVTRSIIKEMVSNPPDGSMVFPVYGTTKKAGYFYANKMLHSIDPSRGQEVESLIDTRRGDIFIGLDLQHQVVSAQEGYLKTLHNSGLEIYFVIYDLLPIFRPGDFADGADLMHADWLTTLCNFDGIVCISKAVADEFIVWATTAGRLRKNFKVDWFHLGSDIDSSIPSMGIPHGADKVIEKLSEVPTFLMVGTLEPRKGHQQTLEAFELLWNEGVEVNLIIVGKKGWKTEALSEEILSHPKLGKRLFWLQGISDEYLDKLYQASSCLIAASYGEGFGLPLVEASVHGIPIIARDIPVFREVAEDSAYFFNGLSPDDLRGALLQWLALKELNSIPDSSVLKRLTWGESAKDLMKGIGLK